MSPRPATSAETSTPTVPSAVTIPATSNVTRAAIAINRTTGYSKSALVCGKDRLPNHPRGGQKIASSSNAINNFGPTCTKMGNCSRMSSFINPPPSLSRPETE